jgi:hypothetical protein
MNEITTGYGQGYEAWNSSLAGSPSCLNLHKHRFHRAYFATLQKEAEGCELRTGHARLVFATSSRRRRTRALLAPCWSTMRTSSHVQCHDWHGEHSVSITARWIFQAKNCKAAKAFGLRDHAPLSTEEYNVISPPRSVPYINYPWLRARRLHGGSTEVQDSTTSSCLAACVPAWCSHASITPGAHGPQYLALASRKSPTVHLGKAEKVG